MSQPIRKLRLILPVAVLLLAANATDSRWRDAIIRPHAIAPNATTQSVTPQPVPGQLSATRWTQGTTATYTINWYSVNGGGLTDATSTSYRLASSIGQSAAGVASSAGHKMGIGFWYGTGAGGCNCPKQGDINGDAVIDVFDVIGVIGIAFSGDPDPQDAGCPKTRGDVDNNGVTDVFDVIYIIATAFSGGPNPVNPCGP